LRIAQIRERLESQKLSADLSVDGGITTATAPDVVKAGADVLVAGTSIFRNKVSISSSIEELRSAATTQ
jgi:ribulose-phosphate 3-epimerase